MNITLPTRTLMTFQSPKRIYVPCTIIVDVVDSDDARAYIQYLDGFWSDQFDALLTHPHAGTKRPFERVDSAPYGVRNRNPVIVVTNPEPSRFKVQTDYQPLDIFPVQSILK